MGFAKMMMAAALILSSVSVAKAQSAAETVLREFAQELRSAGVELTLGAQTQTATGVEWRDVVVTLPRIKGRLTVPFIRATDTDSGGVAFAYPEAVSGVATPVVGLPEMRLTVRGLIQHVVQKPGRAQVHEIKTDDLVVTLIGVEPEARAELTISDFELSHTEDVGVPLRLNRIRDIPMSGAFDLHVYGGLDALDLLVELGEVSVAQGDFARGVASMFAVKGDAGGDHLNVKVEARKNGAFLINGNPL